MSIKVTTKDFIIRAKEIHGDLYDYSISEYTGTHKNIKIRCLKHGVFEQTPGNHYSGKGCLLCGVVSRAIKKRIPSYVFFNKAKEIHGNKYEYGLVNYVDTKVPIKIICPVHGVFEQTYDTHIRQKRGCPICGINKGIKNRTKNVETFIEDAISTHKHNYNYSSTIYINDQTKISILCNTCKQTFKQTPNKHLQGNGCPICADSIRVIKKTKTTQEFIKDAKKLFGDKYRYDKVKYTKSNRKIIIVCSIHGEFSILPSNHLNRLSGCPKCHRSKGEIAIEKYLIENNIAFEINKKFQGCVNKRMLMFDFYIPQYNLCIEFDGYQHFIPFGFGSDNKIEKYRRTILNDTIKNEYCKDTGITLLRIPYNKIKKIDDILNDTFKVTQKF